MPSKHPILPAIRPDPEDWHDLARCARPGVAVDDYFFPHKGGTARDAKRICQQCPVQEPCLKEALVLSPADDEYGVRGGTTPKERRQMRRGAAA
jgi:WhiB family redox-sensing transcriptional regulator